MSKSPKFLLTCFSFILIALLQMSMVLHTPKLSQPTALHLATSATIFAPPIEPSLKTQSLNNTIKKAKQLQQEPKTQLTALLLCIFIGMFGAHRFYTGHYAIAVLQLLTLGCCGIFTLIDLIRILTGDYRDAQGQPLLPMKPLNDPNNNNPNNNNNNGDFYGS